MTETIQADTAPQFASTTSVTGNKRVFHTLDGMRGVAAAAVVGLHAPLFFGEFILPRAYLAVDLFFVLSGFVIAFAYDRRILEGMTPARFMLVRLIRFYPLYLLGTLIAVGGIAAALAVGTRMNWTPETLAGATAMGLLMLPTPPIAGEDSLYPLNNPAWSLFYELVINFVFVLVHRHLTIRSLTLIVTAAALALIWVAFEHHGLKQGFNWWTIHVALCRVTFSFFLGVLLLRLYRADKLPALSTSPWILLVVSALAFGPDPQGPLAPLYDLGCVLLLFPLLVTIGVRSEPTALLGVFTVLGATSYAVYAIHFPIALFLGGIVVKLLKLDIAGYAPLPGLVFLALLLAGCWLIDRFYDGPIRAYLTKRLVRR